MVEENREAAGQQASAGQQAPAGLDAACREALAAITAQGLMRHLRPLSGSGPWAERDGRRVLVLGSNDYLGLSTHPAVARAAAQVAEAGMDVAGGVGTGEVGSGGSRLTAGSRPAHRELEEALAAWKGTEDAVLFGSGYLANIGAIPALAGPGDLILSDTLNHASLIDGCRLSGAAIRVYRHGDADHAAALLRAERGRHRHCLLVTDGVFSMDGDLAPLPALSALARDYGAWLMVDDAHGTGVLGEGGSGTAEHLGVRGLVDVQMGTLSKALGAEGGFVAGSRVLCDLLRNRARSFIFSTAPAAPVVAASLAAVVLARGMASERRELWENACFLREGLEGLGFRLVPGEPRVPIIGLLTGEAGPTMAMAAALEERGVYAPGIRPPAVPPGRGRLRVSVTAVVSREDLSWALERFLAAGRVTGVLGR